MTTPIAGIADLQEHLAKLAPNLPPQPMPKIAFNKGKHGVKTSSALRGQQLLQALCVTDEQREHVGELVAKYNPNDLEMALVGAFDDKTKKYDLKKALFLNEKQLLVHNFVELMELQLEDDESATESLELLLTENGHSTDDVHIAEECLSVAYALQTLLRAFPHIPLSILDKDVVIDEDTDIIKVFGPLLIPKQAKKKQQKPSGTQQQKSQPASTKRKNRS
ncbi:hypothetical protein AC1031_002886 [Aphanomyces cochlioides]|nr:hypothetical protein AC1031_002886 [Aphanomyces cochlioides]